MCSTLHLGKGEMGREDFGWRLRIHGQSSERGNESEREGNKHVCVLLHFISALHRSASADFFSLVSSSSSKKNH